jgi:hypothetical protein
MAEYLLRNSLNPGKVVKCVISFRQLTIKGYEGEQQWVVEINTVEPHKDGASIAPEYINYTSDVNLDLEIKEATERLAAQIDWEPLIVDARAPFVSNAVPSDGNSAVAIDSGVLIDISEKLPATGIDVGSIEMSINGIDVTEELKIDGDPFGYSVFWRPSIVIYDTE